MLCIRVLHTYAFLCPVDVSGQAIGTVKRAEDLVFPAMEDAVLHAITDRLIDAGR